MTRRVVGDLSLLPAVGFRTHGLWGWATLGFIAIEGTGFVLACAAYLFLMSGAPQWPLDSRPPDLIWGSLMTLVMLASLVPNLLASRAARRRDPAKTQLWALVLLVFNLATVVIRAFE